MSTTDLTVSTPTSRSTPSGTVAFVEWESVRTALHDDGWFIDPTTALDALIAAVLADSSLSRPVSFRLFMAAGQEVRRDLRALTRTRQPSTSGGNEVIVEAVLTWRRTDATEIALSAEATAVHTEHPGTDVWIITGDAALSQAAERLADLDRDDAGGTSSPTAGRIVLGLATRSVPSDPTAQTPGPVERLHLRPAIDVELARVADRVDRTSTSSWDELARAYRALAAHGSNEDLVRRYLWDLPPEWRAHVVNGSILGSPRFEAIDAVISSLWRAARGDELTTAEAVSTVRERCAGLVGDREVEPAIEALLSAGLLRFTARDSLTITPHSREGLLFPLRRTVLMLGDEPGDGVTEGALRKRFVKGVPRGADPQHFWDDADAEWSMVRRLLQQRLRVVPGPGRPRRRGRTGWYVTDRHHPFVSLTRQPVPRLIASLTQPQTSKEAIHSLRSAGAARPAEWLYCLYRAGLISRSAQGTWSVVSVDVP